MIADPQLYLAFIAATAALTFSPGPMVAYIVAVTLGHGARHGATAVIGSALASSVQVVVVVMGLAVILETAGGLIVWLKWLGAAYLLYLGVKALRAPTRALETQELAPRAWRRTLAEAFFVDLTNPKALMFHGAFLPLFASPDAPMRPQLITLGVTMVAVALVSDSFWVFAASRARPLLRRMGRWRQRVTGAVLIAAAGALAMARKA